MTDYYIPKNTPMWRSEWQIGPIDPISIAAGGRWTRIDSTKAVIYSEDDRVQEHEASGYFTFRLPAAAAPYLLITVERRFVKAGIAFPGTGNFWVHRNPPSR